MKLMEKINLILKKANITKVNLAKYLGVSRQMVYNYLECDSLDKWPKDKKVLLFKLLDINEIEELNDIEINDAYIEAIESKLFNNKKSSDEKKDLVIEQSGLKKEERDILNDIFFILKEMLNEDKTKQSLMTLTYIYHFLQSMNTTKELKYILGYVSKNMGLSKVGEYIYEEERQYIFESILYSAMTLYTNGGASRNKLMESHKRWEMEIEHKKEEKLSRTQELNTAKELALRELGYTEINEKNASEVFDKIAEIQSRPAGI